MKILLLSDIHGNFEALQAVMKQAQRLSYDQIICLGDLVGYGPQPQEVISFIRNEGISCVLGNHDAGVAGLLPMDFFRDPNRTLLQKTQQILDNESLAWLQKLPKTITTEQWIAAHATPLPTAHWPYLDTARACQEVLAQISQELCFVGHTHRSGIVADRIGVFRVTKGNRYVINPGSVGQSREKDKRASFAIVDTEAISCTIHKCEYDKDVVIRLLEDLGFSTAEARRLQAL